MRGRLASACRSAPHVLPHALPIVSHHVPSPHLNDLDLLADRGQHLLVQAVELIKAAPGSTLDQPHEDAPHALEVKLLVTVEHQDL